MKEPSVFMSDDFLALYDEFSHTLRSERTKVEYFNAVCLYCDYITKDFLDQRMQDALSYQKYLMSRVDEGSFSRTTLRARICAYRKIEAFLLDNDIKIARCWGKIQLPALDSSVSEGHVPSVEDLDRLLSMAKKEGLMWYTVIALVIKCALTASEIAGFTFDNLIKEHDNFFIFFPSKKTGFTYQEDRYMKIPDDCKAILSGYLATLKKKDSAGHLFYNKAGRALTIKNIDDALLRMYKDEKKKYTIKDIRTRAILELLNASSDPAAVSEFVGLSRLRMKNFIEASGIVSGKTTVSELNNIIIRPFEKGEYNNEGTEES